MKTSFVCAALACLALALSTTVAMATNEPIPGVDIIIYPAGGTVMHTQSDANGALTLRGLAPGDYVIEIDGPSLVAAMDKLAPAAPEKKKSGSSFSLGFGGFSSGGGSHHSNEGGERQSNRIGGLTVDPSDPSGNTMANGGTSHGNSHSSSGGGMTAGIAVGDLNGDGNPDRADVNGNLQIAEFSVRMGESGGFSVSQTYCRKSASHGMRFGFTVPPGAGSESIQVIAAILGSPEF